MTKKSENRESADIAATIERLEKALSDARRSRVRAEERIADQSARLEALGSGRAETMRELGETRSALRRASAERDELQKRLMQVESMQTETVALQDIDGIVPTGDMQLPSIDELMASLSATIEHNGGQGVARLSGLAAEEPLSEIDEMIAPELIAPEAYADEAYEGGAAPAHKTVRLLVYMDAAHPIRYPLYQETVTIGRSEMADIQIDGDYISRLHARIISSKDRVAIEDAGSRNGVRINGRAIDREILRHGDVIGLGLLHFTFIEIERS
jgi:FHA domain